MDANSIVRVAGLIGQAGRIRMLTALLDGNGHSASELASAAAISPQTASSHLAKLLAGRLLACERSGRRRLFRLKSAEVAAAIEALGAIAGSSGPPDVPEIRLARTCYDHLAGILAIALRDRLIGLGALRQESTGFAVTASGKRLLQTMDIDVAALRSMRRAFSYKCLDWTERSCHIGGALGAALLTRLIEQKWLARSRDSRALRLTHAGERGFENIFQIRCAELRDIGR